MKRKSMGIPIYFRNNNIIHKVPLTVSHPISFDGCCHLPSFYYKLSHISDFVKQYIALNIAVNEFFNDELFRGCGHLSAEINFKHNPVDSKCNIL